MNQSTEWDIDTVREIPAIPTILDVVCRTTGMGFAAVARVTQDRWIACEVLDEIDFGLKPGGELRVGTTICSEISASHQAVAIDNVSEDPIFCNHLTPSMYGFQSYISVPIVLADGAFFGTLCAIDPKPVRVNTPEILGMFRLFAELIASHLDARLKMMESQENLAASTSALLDARETARLREQFIAILGHDLRNPLAAFYSGVRILLRSQPDEKAVAVLRMMAAGVQRMNGLVSNVLDFARGRLGGGITLKKETRPLEQTLNQVIEEMRVAWPDRAIHSRFELSRPCVADHSRLQQLFSNLLGNAITHGLPDQPIRVAAHQEGEVIVASVTNAGPPIPPAIMKNLFKPFKRANEHSLQGLGLGLFISDEIARAHGGTLSVRSDENGTCFSLSLPKLEADAVAVPAG